MNRLILIFTHLFLLFVPANGQEKTDREKAFLTGPVKKVYSQSVDFRGEKPTGSGRTRDNDTVTYDRAGHEIERMMWNDYGVPIGIQTQGYDYDSRGNLFLHETIYTGEKGGLQERVAYVYERGKLTEVLRYDAKRVLREKTARIYDAAGRLTEEVYSDPTTPRARTIFFYDAKGNTIEMSFFMSDGRKAIAPLGPCLGGHRVLFTYNEKGQPITKFVYDTNGSVKKSWEYKYNEKGLYAEYSQTSVGSKIHHVFSYEYDAHGNWIKETIVSESDMSNMEKSLQALMHATNTTSQPTPEDAKLLREMRLHTTVTTREITYY